MEKKTKDKRDWVKASIVLAQMRYKTFSIKKII